jgi:glycosyltransferase 2 family protein
VTKASFFIGLLWLLAIILAGWTLAQLPLGEIISSLQGLDSVECVLWVALNIFIILALNQRWWLLGKAVHATVDFFELLLIRQAGQSISFITPGPQFGGEPLQIFWLWRRAQVPLHKGLLSLGLDRFFEFIINFFILILGVSLLLMTPASATANWENILALLFTLFASLALLGISMVRRPQWLSQRLAKLAHRWQRHHYLNSMTTHWNLLSGELRDCLQQQKKHLLYATLLSVASWIGLIAEMQLTLWMAGVQLHLTGFLLFFIAMRLALLLPLPGGIGTLEAAIFWSFHYLNIPADSALMVIALMRVRDAAVLIIGLGCVGVLQKPQANTGKAEFDSAH